jgi:Holliday junction resolvase RusA-like endonuclease
MIIQFTVPGVPVGKGRPRVTKYGTYTPRKTKDYEELVRRCWQTQSGQGFSGGIPLLAFIVAYFPIPKRTSKKKAAAMDGTFHLHKPDSDNIAKAVLDALNGLAYPDDSAIQIDRSWKVYTNAAPRVEVFIRPASGGVPDEG